jgi:hypothetical protein
VADNVEEEGSQGRDETLVHELEWLREFTPVTRRAAASLPSMGGERMVVGCHLDIKMIPFLGALARCKGSAFLANLDHTSGEMPVTELRNLVIAAPRPHVERCEVEGRALHLLAGALGSTWPPVPETSTTSSTS